MGVDTGLGRWTDARPLVGTCHAGSDKCSLTDWERRIVAVIHCPITSEEAHMDKADLVIKSMLCSLVTGWHRSRVRCRRG